MTTEQRLTDFAQAVALDIKTINNKLKTYEFVQMVPELQWVVLHNLDKYPSVEVVDSAGTVVGCQIDYVDRNSLIITSNYAFSGKAYLN